MLISNVASKCGFADDSYKGFSTLIDRYYDQGLRVLLFPCNQFGSQEPGDSCSIKAYSENYNKRFIQTEKIEVNGSGEHPIFAWLKKVAPGFLLDRIKWNYTKFLVDREGKCHPYRWGPNDKPEKMEETIKQLLDQKQK